MNIGQYIVRLFETWEKLFILNGKNEEISDCFSNLIKHRLSISAKETEFNKNIEEGELVVKSRDIKKSENIFQLLTVSSILPYLEIYLPEKETESGVLIHAKDSNNEHDYLYSIQEYEKVLPLMWDRLEKTYTNFLEITDEPEELKSTYH